MSEEFIIPEKDEDENDSPKKRITRRKLNSTFNVVPGNSQKTDDEKINNVLSALYEGEENEPRDIIQKKNGFIGKIVTILGVGAALAAILWAGFLFFPQNSKSDSQASVAIQGPTEIVLGATTTYFISYANNSSIALKNVVLSTYFPDGFIYSVSSPAPANSGHNEWDLGALAPYEKGQVVVTGQSFGSLSEQKSWRVFLNYQPLNFNSELQKAATLTTVITSAPVTMSVTGPDQVAIGTDAQYSFTVSADKNWRQNLSVLPNVPANFTITSSSPALNKNNQWLLSPAATSTYSLTGKFTSTSDQPSLVSGTAVFSNANGNYQVASAETSSSLIKNDVNVSLAINGSLADFDSRPGDMLNVTVRIKNLSANDIRGAAVKLTFTSPAAKKQPILNWSNVVDKYKGDLQGVQIDTTTRSGFITWTAKQIPALDRLKPNDVVSIDLQLPVKTTKEFDYSTVTNPIIVATAETHFKDAAKSPQSISTKPITMALNTDLTFTDNFETNSTVGGQQYLINWILNNTFHPLKNIKIAATVFGDVSFGVLNKAAGDLSYDDKTGQLAWTVPEMPDGTDVLNTSFAITLHQSNPTQTLLLSQPHLTADDTVTGKTLDLAGEQISLNSPTSTTATSTSN